MYIENGSFEELSSVNTRRMKRKETCVFIYPLLPSNSTRRLKLYSKCADDVEKLEPTTDARQRRLNGHLLFLNLLDEK